MKREGKAKEFRAAVRRICQEQNLKYGPAQWIAMRELGYTTPKRERELAKEYEDRRSGSRGKPWPPG